MKRIYKITEINGKEEIDKIENFIAVGILNNDSKYAEFKIYSDKIIEALLLRIDEKTEIFLLDEFMLSRIISIATEIGQKLNIEDITNDLFTGKMLIPKTIKEQIEDYLLNTYDSDDVLDKMLEGIELTNIDKLILQK